MLATEQCIADEPSPSKPQEYLNSLIELAKLNRLADKRIWQVLIHYRANLLGSGVTSEIDDPEFFLAPDGKENPESELEATLTAFLLLVYTPLRCLVRR